MSEAGYTKTMLVTDIDTKPCTCGENWATPDHRLVVCSCHKNLCPLYTCSLLCTIEAYIDYQGSRVSEIGPDGILSAEEEERP